MFSLFYFREIFFVPEDMLVVPKMYTTIPSCRLHVIDNDTMKEMPHVFLKVVPHVYPKNKVNIWSIKIIGIKVLNSIGIFSYILMFCLEVWPCLLKDSNYCLLPSFNTEWIVLILKEGISPRFPIFRLMMTACSVFL